MPTRGKDAAKINTNDFKNVVHYLVLFERLRVQKYGSIDDSSELNGMILGRMRAS